jgi:Protein of unknown function (DUF3306)
MSSNRTDEPFLSRWSRQKLTEPRGESEPASPPVDEPELDLSKLPNVDELTAESNIAAFMQKGVPEALQRLALRRVWSLDPSIRDFVEVAENQWDFNAVGGIYGLFQEIEPGTDVSIWLAQATSSLAPPEKPTDVTRVVIDGEVPNISDEKLPVSQVKTDGLPIDEQAEKSNPKRLADSAPQPSPEPPDSSDQAKGSRRRHGGALPV